MLFAAEFFKKENPLFRPSGFDLSDTYRIINVLKHT